MQHMPQTVQTAPRFDALPVEHPLPMPEQSLSHQPRGMPTPDTASRLVPLRRLFVFGTSIAMTIAAAYEMYRVLEVGGLTIPEGAVLGIFVLLFAWIALSFVTTIIGFFAILAGPNKTLAIDNSLPPPKVAGRTALLLPTYNEDADRITARLQAIFESVQETGQIDRFDFFILSDTTDPATWIAEEAAFLRLRARTNASCIFYRHRIKNTARKAGNIAEWVARFGGGYDHMIVLDADSLMAGETILRLVSAMENHPRVGLIQTLPVLVNGKSLFARIQQFAGRLYGPLIARGITWWHGAEGNYWGHNAIIRVKAFAEQAGLPLLRGRKPFGGHILSHDFVEAALLRRAGWGIHMAPSLGGSFEECPPTLTEYSARDRRWCQGNLQHAMVLGSRGLHWMSRLHLLTGIGCYITAPFWLLFLLLGILISLQAQFIRPEYFPSGASLFPLWPAQDPVRAAWVFAATMGLLLVPKILGYLGALVRRTERSGMGGIVRGFLSVLFEVLLSALIAPVMMLMQAKAVVEILMGRDAGWQLQQREDGTLPWGQLVRRYVLPTLLGLALGLAAYAISWPLLLWMSPVLAGLILAIPLAAITSAPSTGAWLRRAGILLAAEERSPPQILVRANQLSEEAGSSARRNPFALLFEDPALFAAHLQMLPPREVRRRGDPDADLVVALAKIAEVETHTEALTLLNSKEVTAVLGDQEALVRLFSMPS